MADKKAKEYTGLEETGEVKKKAVNALDLLLGSDIEKIDLPVKDIEIKRLSEHFGEPFIVTCRALTPDKYEEVQDLAVVIKGKDVEIDMNLLQLFVVIEGTMDSSGELLFKNKEIMKKFKILTPKDLCKKLLLSGEITHLYSTISNLSGFGDEAVDEVKN